MKKIVLGIVLLAVLVVAGYFQSVRDSEKRTKAFRKGHRSGADSVQLSQPDFDSLSGILVRERQALAEYQVAMADSLCQLEWLRENSVDSLERVIKMQDTDMSRLKQQAAVKKSPSRTQQAVESSAKSGPSHQEILGFYKQAMSKLPSDLSDYEYRVSVDEIKAETATKFSITVERLNQIRADNNLDF